jgi:hypothetical protein
VFLFERPRRLDAIALTGAWTHSWARWSLAMSGDLYARRIRHRPVASALFSTAWLDTITFGSVDARAVGFGLAAALNGPRDASVSLAYGLSRTTERDPAAWVHSSWDRPHSLSAVATTPRLWGVSLGAALRHVSGIRATSLLGVVPTANLNPHLPYPGLLFGERNASALPATTRLDLVLRRSWRIGPLRGDLQAQTFNALGARVPMTLKWERRSYAEGGWRYETNWSEVERFHSLGASVRW